MTQKDPFNRNLLLASSALALIVCIKLAETASHNDNWRGFFYSSLHVVIVAAGTILALRNRSNS